MSAKDSTDKLFWLAYCDAIKKQIGELGDSNAIFYSTKNQRGPPVECNAAYTNYGIYNIAANLLQPDNLFYSPSATNTYLDSLISYLSWVDVGGDQSDATKYNIVEARKNLAACQTRQMIELKKAAEQYTEMNTLGVIPAGQKLIDWLPGNAPAYQEAEQNVTRASATLKSACLTQAGPLAGQWGKQMDDLTNAAGKPAQSIAGLNMPTTMETPPSMSEILNASTAGTKLPDPTSIVYMPAFGAPEYASVVKSWQGNASKPAKRSNTARLTLDQGKNIKETSFGQTSLKGDLGFSYGGIVSFGADASSDHSETALQTNDSSAKITIDMFWDDMAKVAVNPGNWNVSNPKGNYPKLKEGAPDSAKVLVRPSQLVLVSKLGYKVTFDGSIVSEFDKKVSDTKSGGGYVKIFGIPISVGASGSTKSETTSHTGTWDKSAGEFTVEPTADIGFATVLAVVGEKVQTF